MKNMKNLSIGMWTITACCAFLGFWGLASQQPSLADTYVRYPPINPGNPGTVTSITGIPPIYVQNGTTTASIGMVQSDSTHDGWLSSADWVTFNSKLGTLSIGNPIASGTVGSVLFIDGSGDLGQDNSHFFWDNASSPHRLGIGTSSPSATLEVVKDNSTAPAVIVSTEYGGNTTNYVAQQARGTIGSPSAVLLNDVIGNWSARAYDGTAFSANNAGININAAENWDATHHGSYIRFRNTPLASTTNTVHMTIDPAGNVGIGTTAPTAGLHLVSNQAETLDLTSSDVGGISSYTITTNQGNLQNGIGNSGNGNANTLFWFASGGYSGGVPMEFNLMSGAVTIGDAGIKPQHILNTATATNGIGIVTLTNAPAGISGNPTGWIQMTINGGTHVMPYW